MWAETTALTLTGQLTDAPELRYLETGTAICRFRIASTPRRLDPRTGEWTDGETLFLNVQVWREQAENVAESANKGTRVMVRGVLRSRTYETPEGEKRTIHEIEADEIGISVRYTSAKPQPRRPRGTDA